MKGKKTNFPGASAFDGRFNGAALKLRIETLQNLMQTFKDEVAEMDSMHQDGRNEVDFYEEVKAFEVALIRGALWRAQGCQVEAARLLNVKKTTLNSMIKRYRIRVEADFDSESYTQTTCNY